MTQLRRFLARRVNDPPELPLVAKTKIHVGIQGDGEMLKPSSRGVVRGERQLSGHPEVNNQGRVVVQVEEEVFSATAYSNDGTTSKRNIDCLWLGVSENPRKVANGDGANRATDGRGEKR
jgi:hypothetical protein